MRSNVFSSFRALGEHDTGAIVAPMQVSVSNALEHPGGLLGFSCCSTSDRPNERRVMATARQARYERR